MSFHPNISAEQFVAQDKKLINQSVVVMFQYESAKPRRGTIVRADAQSPFVTIIQMENNQFILGSECSYKIAAHADG